MLCRNCFSHTMAAIKNQILLTLAAIIMVDYLMEIDLNYVSNLIALH